MIVADGSFLLHRALHVPETAAMRRSVDGMPTGGVLNVLNGIRGALQTYKSDRAVVVFDGGDRSPRRLALYPGYKDRSGKKRTPEEIAEAQQHMELFRHQMSILERALPLFGVRVCRVPTKEGDDVVARVARKAAFFRQVYVVSDDRDMWQLVGPNISVFRPGAAYAGRPDSFITEMNFTALSGISSPRRFLLRKALVGDDSDMIEGVEGIGEKTASEFVEHVGSEFIRQAPPDAVAEQVATIAASDVSKRVRRLAEESAKKIVARNLELMDLDREPWTADEDEFVKRAVFDGTMEFDRGRTMQVCANLEYAKILETWSYWLEPFQLLN